MKAGWHLWSVKVSGTTAGNLWITTENEDLDLAHQKARTFIRNSSLYRDAEIKGIEHHGTLDA